MIIATHWTLIIWVEIKTLQVLQQAKKAPDAWSQHETTHKKKNNQEKVINLNYFLFMLWWLVLWFLSCIHSLRVFLHETSLLLSNLASHASEATTFVIGPEYSNTPTIPCNEWYSYSLTSSVFFPIVWKLHEYYKLMLKSVRLRPPLSKNFDHWVDVLISTSAPSHWLNSVAWPVGPVLKFSCSLY